MHWHKGIPKLFLRAYHYASLCLHLPMKRFAVLNFILAFFSLLTHAQSVVFSAEASANPVGTDDQVQVTFSLENVQEVQRIQNPSFPGFRVLAGPFQSQSTNYSISGNQQVRTSSISLTYVIQAERPGSFTIPPIAATDGSGHTYQSNPLTIRVQNGSLAPKRPAQQQSVDPFGGFDPFDDPFFGGNGGGDPFAAIRQQQARMQQMLQQLQQQATQGGMPQSSQNLPEISEKELGKNIFIRVTVDKTKVNVGEQVTATYKMYTRVPMQAALSKLPSLNGFWTQDFDLPKQQQPQREILDGIPYETFTLKKSALFPQQTGTLVLDPAEAKGVARIPDRNHLYGRDVQFKLSSIPVNITVSPLPLTGQPENFGGAVGRFTLNSSIDKTSLTTDETANLTLTISGSGNLKLIEAPALKLPNGLDAFDPSIVDTITGRSTTISGSKIITYALAPRIPGDYDIPAIPFSFYDSKTGSYTTLYTKPVKLHVTQGKNYRKENAQAKMPGDIHDLIGASFVPQAAVQPMVRSPFYWAIYIISSLALILFILLKRKNEREQQNVRLFKNKYANKIALKRLKAAKDFLDNRQTAPFYEEISKAIWLYLSDKLHIPLSQLSKETAAEALAAKNIPVAVQERMNTIIADCETALYAPSIASQQMDSTYRHTVELIGKLEETLKK